MITTELDVTTPVVFPLVTFANLDGKEFMIPRESVIHTETYCYQDEDENEVLDVDKTFVNFKSPNHKSKGSLHAIVDMPLKVFRDQVMRPAYEGSKV